MTKNTRLETFLSGFSGFRHKRTKAFLKSLEFDGEERPRPRGSRSSILINSLDHLHEAFCLGTFDRSKRPDSPSGRRP